MATFQKVKIKDYCEITSSKRIFADEYLSSGVPFYRGREISEKQRSSAEVSDLIYISREKFEEIKAKYGAPQKGDILLTSVGTIGNPYLVKEDEEFYFKDGNLTWFRNFHGISGKWLYYWLLSPQGKSELNKCTIGSSQKAYTINLLYGLQIELPELSTQTRITSVLSSYDDLIESNEKRIKALEEMAQLLYTEWLVKFKFPGHEKVKMVDSGTEYGKIPEGWEVKKFYDVVNNLDSKRRPISSMKRQIMQGEYPYYGAAKIIDRVNNYIFDGRYLLIAEDGSVITSDGKPMLQFVDEKFWISNHAHIVQGRLLPTEILYLRLRRFNIKPLITGSAQPKITKDNLSRVLFIVPDEKIKNMFADIVTHYFDEIFNLQKQNQNLSQTRDLLIPQLVTAKRELQINA